MVPKCSLLRLNNLTQPPTGLDAALESSGAGRGGPSGPSGQRCSGKELTLARGVGGKPGKMARKPREGSMEDCFCYPTPFPAESPFSHSTITTQPMSFVGADLTPPPPPSWAGCRGDPVTEPDHTPYS